MSGSLLFSCYCWWVNFHSSFGRKRDTLNNAVQVENESRRGCLTEVNFKKLLFCFSIITRGTWRYNVILYFPTMMISIALVTKLVWMLLLTATKTEILTVAYDSFVRARHFTSFVGSMATGIIVSKICPQSFRSLWPCLSFHIWKPLRHSCGKQSRHKFIVQYNILYLTKVT